MFVGFSTTASTEGEVLFELVKKSNSQSRAKAGRYRGRMLQWRC
jgi:hypothetical protein